MTEYVIIPIAQYDDACNAIREKTGTSDLITSDQFGAKIRSISQEAPPPAPDPNATYGDALAEDVRLNKTFVSGGVRKTGSLVEQNSDFIEISNPIEVLDSDIILTKENLTSIIFNPGIKIQLKAPLAEFGDALPEDVAKGKIFTSSNGLKITGTKEETIPPDPTPQPTENEDLKLLLENQLTILKTSATRIGAQRVTGLKTLQKVDLSNCTVIAPKAFQNCSNLNTIIIRSNSVCEATQNSFNGTKLLQQSTGNIYVPRNLLSQYQSQWSFFDPTIFKAIEDNPNV